MIYDASPAGVHTCDRKCVKLVLGDAVPAASLTDINAGAQVLVARWGMNGFRATMRWMLLAAVFALMPSGGDVDILVAAEMMEAGRGILRGFVTPDKTTLITSTHRALAVSEKTVPGDGMANSIEVQAAAEIAAQRFIAFDMEAIAQKNSSVISAGGRGNRT